jgi:Ca2+-binding RTX toxin-like protein
MFQPLEKRLLLAFAPISGEQLVTGPTSVKAYDLAVAGDGSYLVTTIEDAANPTLTAVRCSATGQQLGQPLTLDTLQNNFNGAAVSVAMDADGDAVVAYMLNVEEIYAIRISKTDVVSPRQRIDQTSGDEAEFFWPSVSMDAAGGFFVGWIAYPDTGHVDTIHLRAFDATGAARAAEFVATGTTSVEDTFSQLDVAANPDGSGAVFSFSRIVSIPYFDTIEYGRVSTTALLGEVQGVAGAAGFPAANVATHVDGSFVIGFTRSGGDIDPRAPQPDFAGYVQRFDAQGGTIGDAIELGGSLPGSGLQKHISAVSVDTIPDGGFVAAFTQTVGDTTTVYAQRYGAAGVADPSGPIAIGSGVTRETAVGVANDGRTVVANLRGTTRPDASGLLFLRRLANDPADVAALENGVLYVLGTNAADTVTIAHDGADIVVTRNGASERFAGGDVNVIDADGFGGDDTITKDVALRSTLRGGAGDDTIFGGALEDRLHGGTGDDSLWGRDAADSIFGEDGVDSLYGNGGNDRLEGGAQGDHMRGNDGKDKLLGNGGHDKMYGGANADRLWGGPGNDRLFGEGGADRLYGDDSFVDSLYGGAGDDVFITLDGVIDHLFGDGGTDTATADEDDLLMSIEQTL